MQSPHAKAGSMLTWLDLVRKQVDSLSYGVVQIVVHDARAIQIEHTEKLRPSK